MKAEEGFTVLDLLIAVAVLGILLIVAIPAYLSFAGGANDTAAKANIRTLVPAGSVYKADNDSLGGYTAMTIERLKTYDPDLVGWNASTGTGVTVLSASRETYCLKSVSAGATYYQSGPGAPIVSSPACS
jgi:Tfp pilus assembly protein PilE